MRGSLFWRVAARRVASDRTKRPDQVRTMGKKKKSTSRGSATGRDSSRDRGPARPRRKADETIAAEIRRRWEELSGQKQQIDDVVDEVALDWLDHPDVTGVSTDFKMREGRIVRPLRYVLRIAVTVKRHPRDSSIRGQKIPRRIKGVETDVVASRYRYCQGVPPESRTWHPHPLGGCAIARKNHETDWGTLGAVVTFGDRLMYLTNEHVAGGKGSVVYQPPLPSEPIPPGRWQIGTVLRSGSAHNLKVDCALIAASGRAPEASILGPDGGRLPGKLTNGIVQDDDENFTRTFFVGAATGSQELRYGVVRNTRAVIQFPNGTRLIRQIKVESENDGPLVRSGDSGALLMVRRGGAGELRNEVVGLVVGEYDEDDGSGRMKYGLVANHFHHVRRSLSFRNFE